MAKKLPRRPGSKTSLPPPAKKGPQPSGAGRAPRKVAPSRRRARRGGGVFKLLFLLVFVVVLLAGSVVGYFFYRGRQSLPQTEGAFKLQGLTASVEVRRNERGVPHIRGGDIRDIARAGGFVHAQDRYFQMELARRMGTGRLAELLGAEALDHDRLVRTIGLGAAAAQELDRMAPEGREILEAYAAGVNAYRSAHLEKLPPEFQILKHIPEPWSAVDSLAVSKWLAFNLSFNAQTELLRGELVDVVGVQDAYRLTGLVPPPPLEDEASQGARKGFRLAVLAPLPKTFRFGASNSWVVASERSASGRPLLAADPHLSLSMPSVFYEIHLSGDDLEVAGASIPGIPLVLFGQNQRIAWGMTALVADVQDIYLETVNPENPSQYAYGETWRDIDVLPESIAVKDGPAVDAEVRVTHHGVIVGETDDGRLLAERFDALWNGDHVTALLRINRAGSWQEFTEGLRSWSSPALSFVYADVEGNIGFFPAGDVPVRVGFDGVLPVDGSVEAFEWQGNVPHELKPMIFNPEEGFIVSANQQMLPEDTPYPLGPDTLADYRAGRITDLLQTSRPMNLDDFARIQQDRYDPSTEPVLRIAVALSASGEAQEKALDYLRNWNGQMDRGPAPAIYYALYRNLVENTLRDELGDALFTKLLEFLEAGHAGGLHAIIEDEASPLWDDKNTPDAETRARIFERSLDGAITALTTRLGEDVDGWDWATLHGAMFRHPLGREEPLSWLFSRGPLPFGGSTYTIANAVVSLRSPYNAPVGTSFRFLADLSDLTRSRSIVPTGASGHPLSPHYFDQNRGWLSGDSGSLIGGAPSSALILQP